MAEVETPPALLLMAVQDLHDGERAMADRLGTVRGHCSDAAMQSLLDRDERESADRKAVLAALARDLEPDPEDAENIWLRAILDDAANDAETIARGPVRDIALAGALRKAKQSQRVSYETALALARDLGMAEAAAQFAAMIASAEAADAALAAALQRLSAQACGGGEQRHAN